MRIGTPVAGLLTAVATAVTAVVLGGGVANAASSSADYTKSAVGGVINYKEVLDRAHYWYATLKPAYNQGGSALDLNRTKSYRTDCSGFVDMALHLGGTQDNTSGFKSDTTRFSYLYNVGTQRSLMTPNHIETGDVFDDVYTDPNTGKIVEDHAWLFAQWSSDGTHFSYYNFGGGSSGSAPPEYHTGATFADAKLGFEATSHYKVYRYKKIDMTDPPQNDGPPHS